MTKLKVIGFLLIIALAEINAQRPVMIRVINERDSGKHHHNARSCAVDSSEEVSDFSHSAQLIEYARRPGPHEDSDSHSIHDQYNISEEENSHEAEVSHGSYENAGGSHESYYHHPYVGDLFDSESDSSPPVTSSEEESEPSPKHVKHYHRHHQSPEKSSKKSKKVVYVYKQPPIVVRPKPTNVFIKSKPIVVRPPPLVVHHPAQKPCKPVIKYKPPNIHLKPVIVKISKPKRPTKTTPYPTSTTTTTPCPITTRKPCRKCRTKPSKKCGCRRRHHNQHKFKPAEQKYVHVKYDGSVLT